jgi:2-oxoglutarate ferredoxin oxidoreductase subunit beta
MTTNPPKPKTNKLGLSRADYMGLKSTLCTGCGHDSITNHIVTAFYELGINPTQVAKMSGIGCSSKTPAYFLNQAHGFNSVHGRMPSVSTGAKLANGNLHVIGVSGDGDTASIGMGQFMHLVRRNLDMTYVIENNGVYGLTKGQFSATADKGSKLKKGTVNDYSDIDCCAHAIELGCGYVVRSFSGDVKQCVPLLKGAIMHKGLGLMDILSPCITFNNHEGSTKSFAYIRDHDVRLHAVDYVEAQEEITVEQEAGKPKEVTLHDGSRICLSPLGDDYDPTNKLKAIETLYNAHEKGEYVTGLIYVDPDQADTNTLLALEKGRSLADVTEDEVHPSDDAWRSFISSFR